MFEILGELPECDTETWIEQLLLKNSTDRLAWDRVFASLQFVEYVLFVECDRAGVACTWAEAVLLQWQTRDRLQGPSGQLPWEGRPWGIWHPGQVQPCVQAMLELLFLPLLRLWHIQTPCLCSMSMQLCVGSSVPVHACSTRLSWILHLLRPHLGETSICARREGSSLTWIGHVLLCDEGCC